MLIHLFLILLVSSLGIDLYPGWDKSWLDLFMYSSLSIITIATPLSAVKTILSLSLFNSLSAWVLGVGGP